MRTRARLSRSKRISPVVRRLPRRAARTLQIARRERSVPAHNAAPSGFAATPWTDFQPDPYVDYGRFLTREGGILIVYKDLDQRLRHLLWRVFAWTVATGFEAWLLVHHSPVQATWINVLCFIIVAAINAFIVWKPPEIYRTVEIRPDGMILECKDIFWLRLMENGWPALQPDDDGNQVLCGVYGTRFVEYLTIRRFDDEDRMPEVMGAHLQDAMQQLWGAALATGAAQRGSARR
jgi:hypothetical protein